MADTVVFGSHGRVLRRKGYIEMVHAARRAIDRMTEDERARVHFAVIGDTPEDFRPDHVEECRHLARELGIDRAFTFVGFKNDVAPYVADFDVAVVPSVYADPLPRAVIESMALGKPVVAFDVGGVSEMLEDGVTGSLIRAPDTDAMAAQMLRYLRDPNLRATQGRAGRERVARNFDARAHARIMQEEILRAVGSNASRRAQRDWHRPRTGDAGVV
jgi:glycosyltransferase involved in cell wall biosynthesis